MKVLVLGSGGREYALVGKIANEGHNVFCCPGSDGMKSFATSIPLDPCDPSAVSVWAKEHHIDLVVVGPEAPLISGVPDACRKLNIPVFGHSQKTSQLEGSKSFAKQFMVRHHIPCGNSQTITTREEAQEIIDGWSYDLPIVIKADGIAGGKGVVLASSKLEATATVDQFLDGQYGTASKTIVLEEFLEGIELSQHILININESSIEYAVLSPCQDHKRLLDNDQGPNTGGMGAFCPIPFFTEENRLELFSKIIEPTLIGMQKDHLWGQGVIFLGVMWTHSGPKLLEYNCRFGDPETQVLLNHLNEPLTPLLHQIALGSFKTQQVKVKAGYSVSIVIAAKGYPAKPESGTVILMPSGALNILHASTQWTSSGWVTGGGRVLNVVQSAPTLSEALSKALAICATIHWEGVQYRKDIGLRAVQHHEQGLRINQGWSLS